MKNTLLLTFCLAIYTLGFSQDIHFSQFYNSPLTINPALAGKVDADYRANLNYRTQWYGLKGGRGINTFAASADGRILEDALPRYDKLGIGLQAFYDSAGDGYYNTTTIAPTIAYHKALGYNHKIAVGLQPGFSSTGIDFSNLTFENQYVGIGFDKTLPTGENFKTDNVSYLDLGGGAYYSYRDRNDRWDAFLGAAIFHINNPKINFLDGTTYSRPQRSVINGGGTLYLDNGFLVSPSVLYMKQASANELNVGAIVGKSLGNPRIIGSSKSVYGGAFWRKGDAIIGKAGFQYDKFSIGLSSDFAISDIKKPVGLNSALEFSLTLLGNPDKDAKPIYCPTF